MTNKPILEIKNLYAGVDDKEFMPLWVRTVPENQHSHMF